MRARGCELMRRQDQLRGVCWMSCGGRSVQRMAGRDTEDSTLHIPVLSGVIVGRPEWMGTWVGVRVESGTRWGWEVGAGACVVIVVLFGSQSNRSLTRCISSSLIVWSAGRQRNNKLARPSLSSPISTWFRIRSHGGDVVATR